MHAQPRYGLAEVPVAGGNYLKYTTANYGIDQIYDYAATIETNTKIADNPAHKEGDATVREAEKNLAPAERRLAVLLADPAITPAVKNARLIPAAEREIATARRALDSAKKAATRSSKAAHQPDRPPGAGGTAAHRPARPADRPPPARAQRRAWLSDQLNAYLRDDDGYRAIARETIIRGTAGIITFAPETVTSPSSSPPSHASPAPWPCSSTRSTPSHRRNQATPGPSPTSSLRAQRFNTRQTAPSGDLGLLEPFPGKCSQDDRAPEKRKVISSTAIQAGYNSLG